MIANLLLVLATASSFPCYLHQSEGERIACERREAGRASTTSTKARAETLAATNQALVGDIPVKDRFIASVSAYTSEVGQTDNDPCIAANGSNICARVDFSEGRMFCAANDFPFGTYLILHKDPAEVERARRLHPGEDVSETWAMCEVVDRMNRRFTFPKKDPERRKTHFQTSTGQDLHYVDLYLGKNTAEALKWGRKTLVVSVVDVDAFVNESSEGRYLQYCGNNRDWVYPVSPVRPGKLNYITSPYGNRNDPFTGAVKSHSGVDFDGTLKTFNVAAADGVVIKTSVRRRGGGKEIFIRHANGWMTSYSHNNRILVKKGQVVKKGQPVGQTGTTGRSTGVHLHFMMYYKGKKVDPFPHICPGRRLSELRYRGR